MKSVKGLSIVVAAASLVTALPVCAAESVQETSVPSSSYEIVEQMGLGFNIGRTFEDVANNRQNLWAIKHRIMSAYKQGFNTVRIPVEFMTYADANGNIIEDDRFKMVKDAVDYAYDKGMYIILDSMNDLGNSWDLSEVESEKFVTQYTNMWSSLSDIFNEEDYDYHLVFEAYNEPINKKGKVTGFGYDYQDNYNGRADSWYFAGRCNNLKYMMELNGLFADIMEANAPGRYYMVSSYNMDPVSAYTNYKNMTWENEADHNVNGTGCDAYLKFDNVDQSKAIYSCHVYKYGNDYCNTMNKLYKTFSDRGINLPIYVTETGTHKWNFEKSSGTDTAADNFAKPIEYMAAKKSGICLWDDTMDMSYMDPWKFNWRNQALMDRFTNSAGSTKRTETKMCNLTFTSNGQVVDSYVVEEDTPFKSFVESQLTGENEAYKNCVAYNKDNVTIEYNADGDKYKYAILIDPQRYIVKDTTIECIDESELRPRVNITFTYDGDKVLAAYPYLKGMTFKDIMTETVNKPDWSDYDKTLECTDKDIQVIRTQDGVKYRYTFNCAPTTVFNDDTAVISTTITRLD